MYRIIYLFAIISIIAVSRSNAQWTIFDFNNTGYNIVEPRAVKISALGEVWVGTKDAGVFQYDGTSSWTGYDNGTTSNFPNDYINVISIYGNQVVVGTGYGGAGKFSSGSWTEINTADGLADNEVWGTSYDGANDLWYATYSGLSKESGGSWQTYNTGNSTGMPTNHLYCIAIDADNNKWLGTSGFGLLKFNNTTWQTYTTSSSSIPSNTINKVLVTDDDKLWVCTSNGIAFFDKNSTWTVYNSSNTPAILDNNIKDIAMDNSGNIYLATANGLVVRKSGGDWKNWNSGNSNLPENSITSVTVNSTLGQVWVGTNSSGVAKISSQVLSIEDQIFETNTFNLYPVPVADDLNIAVSIAKPVGKIIYSIVNSHGQEVYKEENNSIPSGNIVKTISLTSFSSGVYSVKIEAETGFIVKKIIKY